MNETELAVELTRNHLTVSKAAEAIGIGKKAFYAKMRAESQLKQLEIQKLKSLLNLSYEIKMEIFLIIFPVRNKGGDKMKPRKNIVCLDAGDDYQSVAVPAEKRGSKVVCQW